MEKRNKARKVRIGIVVAWVGIGAALVVCVLAIGDKNVGARPVLSLLGKIYGCLVPLVIGILFALKRRETKE